MGLNIFFIEQFAFDLNSWAKVCTPCLKFWILSVPLLSVHLWICILALLVHKREKMLWTILHIVRPSRPSVKPQTLLYAVSSTHSVFCLTLICNNAKAASRMSWQNNYWVGKQRLAASRISGHRLAVRSKSLLAVWEGRSISEYGLLREDFHIILDLQRYILWFLPFPDRNFYRKLPSFRQRCPISILLVPAVLSFRLRCS